MEILSIFIWTIVVVMFVIMIAVIMTGGKALVYVFDEFNGVTQRRGKVKGTQVSFKYNDASKGGVAIENNTFKKGKKKAYLYQEVNGILLPISTKKVEEKKSSLFLSTSQEKLYETEALKNVAKKIDNTWWAQMKPLVMGAIIVLGAVLVSIVMIQKAMDVEPVPEPQVEMWKGTIDAVKEVAESNKQLVEEIRTEKNIKSEKQKDEVTPK